MHASLLVSRRATHNEGSNQCKPPKSQRQSPPHAAVGWRGFPGGRFRARARAIRSARLRRDSSLGRAMPRRVGPPPRDDGVNATPVSFDGASSCAPSKFALEPPRADPCPRAAPQKTRAARARPASTRAVDLGDELQPNPNHALAVKAGEVLGERRRIAAPRLQTRPQLSRRSRASSRST
jgi:hypothetical protein